jgi:hypothetical protein
MDVLMYSIQGGKLNSKVHLYNNDYTPSTSSILANFTETLVAGLSAKPLPTMQNLGIDASGNDVWISPQITFVATGVGLPDVIYGFWVDFTDPITAGTRVFYAQRFETPMAIIAAGNKVQFMLSLGGKQC